MKLAIDVFVINIEAIVKRKIPVIYGLVTKKDFLKISKHALPIEKEQPLPQELEHFIDCVR